MKILSCGAGMQSTALALMSCENALIKKGVWREGENTYLRKITYHKRVPIYDAVIFCDLGQEPGWVYDQVYFIQCACEWAEIPFYVLETNLSGDYKEYFGKSRVVSIPFWTIDENGKKGRMQRNCTLDYKINAISKFVRWNLLGYKKGQRLKEEDIKTHEMHIGFSKEERQRIFDNPNKLFINKFPLAVMGLERKDNYAYILEAWGLETKASACTFCPFHTNYFFRQLKYSREVEYKELVEFDDMLEREQPNTKIRSKLYISKSRKRISTLEDEECEDKEIFEYKGDRIWNGF